MPATPHLALPLIAAAQAQKHVTHNEALGVLDALLHCAVLDKDLAAPPGSPAAGARYIVAAPAAGAWAGKAGQIAAWADGVWTFHPPKPGFVAYVADEGLLYVHKGAGWTSLLGVIQEVGRLGIGTSADALNPFSAKLNGALWTARTAAEGGSGDLRCALNKEAPADVLSLLFQTGSSGRAEIGLIGTDKLTAKVSADGTSWTTALTVDGGSGLDFLACETALASAATCDLGSVGSLRVRITGAAPITSFGAKPNSVRLLRFAGALTLAHDATALVLPGGGDLLTAAGDAAIAVSDGSGHWRIVGYQRADGTALKVAHLSFGLSLFNTAVGPGALASNTTGTFNTALGASALGANTSGASNTASGLTALYSNTTGELNTAIGQGALYGNTTGARNTAIGYGALSAVADFANCSGIGYNAQVTGSNQVQLGNALTTAYTYGAVQNRSDARDKADVRDTALGLAFILALRPVDFRWDVREDYRAPPRAETAQAELAADELAAIRPDRSRKRRRFHHGLIAQEVKASADAMGVEFGGYQDHAHAGGEGALSLGYTELIGPMIRALQEIAALNGELRSGLARAGERVAALERRLRG